MWVGNFGKGKATVSYRNAAEKTEYSHFAYRQSIIPLTNSSLFCRLKLMKFVSINTRYGGTRAVLCWRNREEATWGLRGRVQLM